MLCVLIRSGSLKIHENFVTALVQLHFFHTNIGLRRNFHYFYHHAVIIWLSRCRCCCCCCRLDAIHDDAVAHDEEERMSSCNFPQFIVITWVFVIVVILVLVPFAPFAKQCVRSSGSAGDGLVRKSFSHHSKCRPLSHPRNLVSMRLNYQNQVLLLN